MTPATPPFISVRLRRVTVHCARVQVPVDETVMRQAADASGLRQLDVEKVMAAAVIIGVDSATVWEAESDPQITPHPIQTPRAK